MASAWGASFGISFGDAFGPVGPGPTPAPTQTPIETRNPISTGWDGKRREVIGRQYFSDTQARPVYRESVDVATDQTKEPITAPIKATSLERELERLKATSEALQGMTSAAQAMRIEQESSQEQDDDLAIIALMLA